MPPQYHLFLGIFFLAGTLRCEAFVPTHQPSHRAVHSRASKVSPSLSIPLSTNGNYKDNQHHYGRISTHRHLGLASLQEPVTKYVASLLRNTGGVPFDQAFSINALGISLLIKPLSKMLTGEGILHALILGTSLWKTLGWRGWSVCVAYLFAGSLVTKIGFKRKDKLGIAEGRGGKRGPENLWYVLSCHCST